MLRRNREDKDVTMEDVVQAFRDAHKQMAIDHPALDGAFELDIMHLDRAVVYKFTINTGVQRIHKAKFNAVGVLLLVESKRLHAVLEQKFYDAWGEDLLVEANTTNRFNWIGGNLYD